MCKHLHIGFAALLGLLLLASCGKDGEGWLGTSAGKPIAFRVSWDDGSGSSATKSPTDPAAIVTSLTSFNVSAFTGTAGSAETEVWTNVAFTKETESAPVYTASGKSWPGSDPHYGFYASNVDLTFNATGATVLASNSTDVVCAKLTSATFEMPNNLTFEHIFSQVGTVTVTSTDDYVLRDVVVSLYNIGVAGTYDIFTGTWRDLTSIVDYVPIGSLTGPIASGASATSAKSGLLVVPGSYTLSVSYNAYYNGFKNPHLVFVRDVVFEKGKEVSLTLTVSGNAVQGVTRTRLMGMVLENFIWEDAEF